MTESLQGKVVQLGLRVSRNSMVLRDPMSISDARIVEVKILLDDGKRGTSVKLASSERLRGLSRLGSPMMRMATRKRLDEALDGIERAVGES